MRLFLEYVGLLVVLVFSVDAFISVMRTCHDIGYQPGNYQTSQYHCDAFSGLFLSKLIYVVEIMKSEWVIAIFTVILAVSTIGLWGVTWIGIRNQSCETRILQRAYLSVDGLGFFPLGYEDAERRTVAHLSIRNVGKLPARNVRWFINYAMDQSGRRSDFKIDEQKNRFYGDGNVIPPGTEMRRSKYCSFSREDFEAFKFRLTTIYVWGEVRYDDGFGIERFTKFCHRDPPLSFSSTRS